MSRASLTARGRLTHLVLRLIWFLKPAEIETAETTEDLRDGGGSRRCGGNQGIGLSAVDGKQKKKTYRDQYQ